MKIYNLFITFLIAVIFYGCNNDSSDQLPEDARPGKLYRSEKVGFFTDQMNFTQKEARQFWPVYNHYAAHRDSLWRSQRHFLMDYNRNKLDIDSGKKALERFLLYEQKRDALRERYIEKLRAFMSDERILQLFYTEHQFKHFMLNRIRGRHGMGQGREKGREHGRGRMNQCP